MNYKLERKKLELAVNWKISRSEFLFKENYFLLRNGIESEIAPNIRYGETEDLIESNFLSLQDGETSGFCHSFSSAYNNIKLKTKALSKGVSLSEFLNLPLLPVKTSFSIPIMPVADIKDYINSHNEFFVFKLKIAGKESFDLLDEVFKCTDKPIRIDANEGFSNLEEYLEFESRYNDKNIEFIEQPFRAQNVSDYIKLKPISKFLIIADESIEDTFDVSVLKSQFHGVNIKQMKAGGILASRDLLEKAQNAGLKTMLGCMIESSLGISEAMHLASLCDYLDLDGALLLKNDPYQDLVKLKNGFLHLK